ncbi:MAG: hypothetical protein JWQ74_3236 [Marmoricola sp.]|nr:hypothetical protein [Marmoricola sp.]
MRAKLSTLLVVIGAVTVLALAGNTVALATTGKALIAGKTNASSKITTIQRTTTGSALQLTTSKTTSPPLVVNGTGTVKHLSADTVDGLDSTRLRSKTYLFEANPSTTGTTGFDLNTSTLPAGTYQALVSGWIYGPTGTASGHLNCNLLAGSPTRFLEQVLPLTDEGYYTLSIGGVLQLDVAQTISMSCDGPTGDYSVFPNDPLRVSLTRLDQVVTDTTSLAGSRVAAHSRQTADH